MWGSSRSAPDYDPCRIMCWERRLSCGRLNQRALPFWGISHRRRTEDGRSKTSGVGATTMDRALKTMGISIDKRTSGAELSGASASSVSLTEKRGTRSAGWVQIQRRVIFLKGPRRKITVEGSQPRRSYCRWRSEAGTMRCHNAGRKHRPPRPRCTMAAAYAPWSRPLPRLQRSLP